MNKAVIYSRVSTEDQKYERQIDLIERYTTYQQLEIVGDFSEKISGTIRGEDRPEFQNMLKYIKENDIKHVVVWDLTRLGRKQRDVGNIIDNFTDEKICVHVVRQNLKSLDSDGKKDSIINLIITNLTMFAEMEHDSIVTNSSTGLARHIEHGGSKSIPPYGFKSVNKMLELDEEEGKVVIKIFELYENGLSTAGIAKHLNSKGIKTKKSGKWIGKNINDLLHNPIYYGKRRYRHFVHLKDKKGKRIGIDKTVTPRYLDTEPYISKDRWDIIQQLMSDRTCKKDNSSEYINILQGLIKCGKCGLGLGHHRRENRRDNVYKCMSTRTEYKCGTKGVNIDNLNSLMYHALNVIGPVSGDEAWLEKIQLKLDEANAELDNALDEIEKADKRIDSFLDLLADKTIPKDKYNQKVAIEKANIKKANNNIRYWTNEITSYESYLYKSQPDMEIVEEDGIKYAVFPDEPKDYSQLNHYSDVAATLKSQIKNAVAGVFIHNYDLEGDFDSYKLDFPHKQSFPTRVTIKLKNGKEYDYVLPSRYKNYIDPDGNIKKLTQYIDIDLKKPVKKG